MMFYDEVLSPRLLQHLEAGLAKDPDEQLAVYTELALLRHVASHAVAMYSACDEAAYSLSSEATVEDKQKVQQRLIGAGALAREALEGVVEVATKAAKIRDRISDRFGIHDVKYVVERMLLLVGQEFNAEDAERFRRVVEEQLVLPATMDNDRGTELHPDDIAREFDETVPYTSDIENEESEF